MALARFSTTARWMDWRLNNDCSLSELLERFDQTPRLVALMWRPLCLAALNTPPERASAQVFLAVLRDSLGARRAASDMLVPRADLSALFPDAAAAWLQAKGNTIHLGAKVTSIRPAADRWTVEARGAAVGGGTSSQFDGVVLAASAAASAGLLSALQDAQDGAAGAAGFAELASLLAVFQPEPITTCYLQYAPGTRLDIPFYALIDDPAARRWGQFVFDRGQLDAKQDGLFAVVISASSEAASLPQEELTAAVATQLAADLARPELSNPAWNKVITEKRATYACAPGLKRPSNETPAKGLVLAGDYTAGEYPATLEMAVRSGVQAARLLAKT
jgi:squalene-associated FAD-dependent desaturase